MHVEDIIKHLSIQQLTSTDVVQDLYADLDVVISRMIAYKLNESLVSIIKSIVNLFKVDADSFCISSDRNNMTCVTFYESAFDKEDSIIYRLAQCGVYLEKPEDDESLHSYSVRI